jgi:hypothetical protein
LKISGPGGYDRTQQHRKRKNQNKNYLLYTSAFGRGLAAAEFDDMPENLRVGTTRPVYIRPA